MYTEPFFEIKLVVKIDNKNPNKGKNTINKYIKLTFNRIYEIDRN